MQRSARRRFQRPRCATFTLVRTLLLVAAIALEVAVFAHWEAKVHFETVRAGEPYISDETFITCLRERLDGDRPRIPFVIIPVTLEYLDFKTYICALEVPIQHLMIVISGDFAPFVSLGQAVNARFASSGRVVVRFYPRNLGYSASMNEGLRSALEQPPETVPWVLLTNSDVRYTAGFWPSFMQTIAARTRNDAAQLLLLREEKQRELHSQWPVGYGNGSHVVASALLPDRIRHMSSQQMKEVFAQHVGLFYGTETPQLCSFVRTRLHIETVGYFDENYYPIYGEDHDLQWRTSALGFQEVTSPPGLLTHFATANVNAVKEDFNGRVVVQSPQLRRVWQHVKRMSRQGIRWRYRHAKWFPISTPLGGSTGRHALPFNGSLPVDVWVRDDARIQQIREIGVGAHTDTALLDFNLSLLDEWKLKQPSSATPTPSVVP